MGQPCSVIDLTETPVVDIKPDIVKVEAEKKLAVRSEPLPLPTDLDGKACMLRRVVECFRRYPPPLQTDPKAWPPHFTRYLDGDIDNEDESNLRLVNAIQAFKNFESWTFDWEIPIEAALRDDLDKKFSPEEIEATIELYKHFTENYHENLYRFFSNHPKFMPARRDARRVFKRDDKLDKDEAKLKEMLQLPSFKSYLSKLAKADAALLYTTKLRDINNEHKKKLEALQRLLTSSNESARETGRLEGVKETLVNVDVIVKEKTQKLVDNLKMSADWKLKREITKARNIERTEQRREVRRQGKVISDLQRRNKLLTQAIKEKRQAKKVRSNSFPLAENTEIHGLRKKILDLKRSLRNREEEIKRSSQRMVLLAKREKRCAQLERAMEEKLAVATEKLKLVEAREEKLIRAEKMVSALVMY